MNTNNIRKINQKVETYGIKATVGPVYSSYWLILLHKLFILYYCNVGGAGDDTPIYTEDYKFFWADPHKKMKKCSVNFLL